MNRFRTDAGARRLAHGLLALNFGMILLPIVLEMLERTGALAQVSRPMIHPSTDGSLPEMLNYAQTGLCVALLALVAWRLRSQMALAWALVFAFVLADDSLQYHEHVGAWLARLFALPAVDGLRSVDLGELLAWGLAGLVVMPVLALSFWRCEGTERGVGLVYLSIFAGLVFFGMGMDMAHVIIASPVMMVIEDGGEMITIALAVIVSLVWVRRPRKLRSVSV